jgi:hypothetical protein
MTYEIEVVLRNEKDASVERAAHVREPREWTEADVRAVLEAILLAVNRVKNPETPDPAVALRGFSWIVEPFDEEQVVIAVEIPMGAAVAGPFRIDRDLLTTLVARTIAHADTSLPPTVH